MKYKLIYLEWEDATSKSSWETPEDALEWFSKDNSVACDVGWLIKETKTHLLIASRYMSPSPWAEESLGLLEKIPKGWIKKRVDLTKYIYENKQTHK
jgi:hypothetical protein